MLHKFPLLYHLHVLSASLNRSQFLIWTFLTSNLDQRLFQLYKFLCETIQAMLTEYYCRKKKQPTQTSYCPEGMHTQWGFFTIQHVFSLRKQLKIRSERKRSASHTSPPPPSFRIKFL